MCMKKCKPGDLAIGMMGESCEAGAPGSFDVGDATCLKCRLPLFAAVTPDGCTARYDVYRIHNDDLLHSHYCYQHPWFAEKCPMLRKLGIRPAGWAA